MDSDSEDDEAIINETKASEYDEKAAAIHALGEFANSCPIKFTPYFNEAYKILDDHYQFFYETIRVQVSSCYVNLTKGLIKSQNNGKIPEFTPGLPCIQRYPEKLETHFKTELVPRLLFMMTED